MGIPPDAWTPGPDEPPQGPRRRWWWLLIPLVAVLIGAGAVYALSGHNTGTPTTESSRPPAAQQPGPSDSAGSAAPSPSASASASPSKPSASPTKPAAGNTQGGPTIPNRANCGPNPSACGLPDASNTGVPSGTKLTVVNGGMTITTPGTVVDGKDIRGCVTLKAKNVTIRRSKITCSDYFVVTSFAEYYSGGGLLIEDSELDCGHANTTGVGSYGFTARRLNIHGCENGFDVDTDVTITDSYIHDFYEGSAGHADGVQLSVGARVTITHNTIVDTIGTSAIISNAPQPTNVLVANNLMAGGAYTLYCPPGSSQNYRVINNRFSTIVYPKGGEYGPWTDCDRVAQATGNLWDTNLQPLSGF